MKPNCTDDIIPQETILPVGHERLT
ncbi:unnamed protein product, partial [Rotaria magnacalcarata]